MLVFESAGKYDLSPDEESEVKGQRFYPVLELDEDPIMTEPIKREQIVLIKKALDGLKIKK